MPATLTTIAKTANVSLPLVSRFVNGDPSLRIVHEKRLLIEDAIRKHGGIKQRNTIGNRITKKNQTYNIAIPHSKIFKNERYLSHMPHISYWTGLEDYLSKNGFRTSITYFEPNHELQTISQLVKSKTYCDGLILADSMVNETSARLILDEGMPHISFDRNAEKFGINTICDNIDSGMMQAISHLKALGHKKIGFFSPMAVVNNHYTAFISAMIKENLRFEEKWCYMKPNTANTANLTDRLDASKRIFREWLKTDCGATAILTYDAHAISALQVLQENNLKPGRDISIVGYEDYTINEFPEPVVKLTSIYRNGWLLGRRAGERLLDQIINNRKDIIQERVHAQLIIGKSTGKCKA